MINTALTLLQLVWKIKSEMNDKTIKHKSIQIQQQEFNSDTGMLV